MFCVVISGEYALVMRFHLQDPLRDIGAGTTQIGECLILCLTMFPIWNIWYAWPYMLSVSDMV